MATSRLTPEQIAQVSGLVAQYITTQREKYTSRATQLSAQQKANMAGFFSLELLHDARLLVLSGERVINPDFYPMLRNWSFRNLPDQSAMERTKVGLESARKQGRIRAAVRSSDHSRRKSLRWFRRVEERLPSGASGTGRRRQGLTEPP
jgi:hypothetical protein